jgi:hypothetical protein
MYLPLSFGVDHSIMKFEFSIFSGIRRRIASIAVNAAEKFSFLYQYRCALIAYQTGL